MSNRVAKNDVRRLVEPIKSPKELLMDLKNTQPNVHGDDATHYEMPHTISDFGYRSYSFLQEAVPCF